MTFETRHWRTFNVMRRLFGLMALLVGSAFILQGPMERLGWAEGPPLASAEVREGVIIGLIAIAIGAIACTLRPFRPDLGDPAWASGTFYPPSPPPRGASRSWWTGDVKHVEDRDHDA